jgi:hypothetical protein
MSNQHEQHVDNKFNRIRVNIFWCLLYLAALVVLYFDLMVWRPN